MNISGKIEVAKKKYGKYDPNKDIEGISFGRKKILPKEQKPQKDNYEELTGINELDVNILNTEVITSEPLRLEIQLSNSEAKLKKIRKELKNNELIDFNNPETCKKLSDTEKKIENNIKSYREQYRKLGLAYKIADFSYQAELNITNSIVFIGEKIRETPLAKAFSSIVPAYKQKQQVKAAQILSKKIDHEMSHPVRANSREIEKYLLRAEKLITSIKAVPGKKSEKI